MEVWVSQRLNQKMKTMKVIKGLEFILTCFNMVSQFQHKAQNTTSMQMTAFKRVIHIDEQVYYGFEIVWNELLLFK